MAVSQQAGHTTGKKYLFLVCEVKIWQLQNLVPFLFCAMRMREGWLSSLLNILLQTPGLIMAFYHFPLYSCLSNTNSLNLFSLPSETFFQVPKHSCHFLFNHLKSIKCSHTFLRAETRY